MKLLSSKERIHSFYLELKDLGKLVYVAAFLAISLFLLLEIKRHYHIDVLPNYNSDVDDWYAIVRGTLSEWIFGKD